MPPKSKDSTVNIGNLCVLLQKIQLSTSLNTVSIRVIFGSIHSKINVKKCKEIGSLTIWVVKLFLFIFGVKNRDNSLIINL